MKWRGAVVIALAMAVMASAVGVVYSKHRSRRLFVELQGLKRERDQLNVEWGRLRLEQGAWATHGRIEKIANSELDMRMPTQDEVVIVTVPR
ncbi:MAG: cell division protein FtsL [Ectothiorhodospiraceae bacterium]|jgi:cell division protein FtsL